jgi:predicted Zn-dependent protease with MMP-like domain
MHCSREEFEAWVWEAVSAIPKTFRDRMHNLAFTVEWEPPTHVRQELAVRAQDDLLGLYQGLPNTHRGAGYGNVLPDKISIYQRPLMDMCSNSEELQKEIRRTVWHEVGHYFGLSEAQLRQLEHPSRLKEKKTKKQE